MGVKIGILIYYLVYKEYNVGTQKNSLKVVGSFSSHHKSFNWVMIKCSGFIVIKEMSGVFNCIQGQEITRRFQDITQKNEICQIV